MFGSTFLYLPSELMAGQPEGAYRNEVHAISYRKSTFMETDDSWRVILQTVLGKIPTALPPHFLRAEGGSTVVGQIHQWVRLILGEMSIQKLLQNDQPFCRSFLSHFSIVKCT